jgi:DNA polymerase III subunit delta'
MSWSRIRGHDLVRERFETAFQAGRLGQAYLFLGPSGIGKKLFAQELSKALLCEANAGKLLACSQCPSCKLFEAATHPDFLSIAKEEEKTELSIDIIRTLCNNLGLTPSRGRKKIAIIDDADTLNEESSNAFLKTLEEPSAGSLLILIGTEADLQLPTILSRCQLVRFSKLKQDDLVSVLMQNNVGSQDAERLTAIADGCVGLALQMNNPSLWQYRDSLLRAICNRPFRRTAVLEIWQKMVEDAGKNAPAQRQRASISAVLVLDFLKRVLRYAMQSDYAQLQAAELPQATTLIQNIGPDGLLEWIDAVQKMNERVDWMVTVNLSIDVLVDTMHKFARS